MSVERHPAQETLSAYLDGELAGSERFAIAAHLETCESCREVLAAYVRVDRDAAAPALGNAGARTERDWEALAARIDRAIDAESGTSAVRVKGARPAAAGPDSRRAARAWIGSALSRAFARPSIAWGAAGTFAAVLLVLVLRPETERFARGPEPEPPAEVSVPPSPAPVAVPSSPPSSAAARPGRDARIVRPGAGTFARGELAKPPGEAMGGEESADTAALGDKAATGATQEMKNFAKAPSPPAFLDPPAAPKAIAGVAPPAAIARMQLVALLADSLAALDAEVAFLDALASESGEPANRKASRVESSREMSRDAAVRAKPSPDANRSSEQDSASPPAQDAVPETRLAREIDLVARIVALDPEGRCDAVRARTARWHADPAWGALAEESLRRVRELEVRCPE